MQKIVAFYCENYYSMITGTLRKFPKLVASKDKKIQEW